MEPTAAALPKAKGTEADLDKLEQLADVVRRTTLCGLGQTAPNPVLSTLEHFRDEYLAHIDEKRCPAGVCSIGQPERQSAEVGA